MKELWLIRHGESEGNVGNKTTSTQANRLTINGKKQATNLGVFLTKNKMINGVDLIMYSKYIRAEETMRWVTGYGNGLSEKWDIHEFTYLSEIKYVNTSQDDRAPARENYWNKMDPDYRDGDTAESFNDLILRSEKMLRRFLQTPHCKAFAFTHGQFIKLTWLLLINETLNKKTPTMKEFLNFSNSIDFPNTGILKIDFENGINISQLSPLHIKW